ncbi:Gag-polypeptide of LTR copia-type [Sesbania bispinosa]|nr:Gag-polypeptide of LTR copia-type [Sesbania bispinosa]
MEDASNPLFLHHSDGPGINLVSQPLTGSNYNTWSRAMIIALSVKNKLGFVDGSIPQPPADDPQLAAWFRCNNVNKSKGPNVVAQVSDSSTGTVNQLSAAQCQQLIDMLSSQLTVSSTSNDKPDDQAFSSGQAVFNDDWEG